MEASSAPAPATPAGQRASLTAYRVFAARAELGAGVAHETWEVDDGAGSSAQAGLQRAPGSSRDLLWIGDCQARNREDAGDAVVDAYDAKDLPTDENDEAAKERLARLVRRLDAGEIIGVSVAPISAIGDVHLEAVVERKLKVKR